MNVTVFGATGAIGSLTVAELLERGHTVTAYARNRAKVPSTWGDRVRVVIGEMSDLTWASIWPCTVVQCAGLRVRVSAEAGLRTSLGLSVAWCGYLVHARGRGSRPVSARRRCAPAVPPGRGTGVAARRQAMRAQSAPRRMATSARLNVAG